MAESNIPFSISCSNQFTTEPISPQTNPSQSTLSQNQDSNHHLMNQTSPIPTSNLQITELKQNMNSNPNQTDHQISVADESPSFQPTPLQNHSLQSLIEQLLLPSNPSTNSPNPAGLLHLRFEPIQLHINSSSQSQLPNQTGQSSPTRSPSKPASPPKEITQKEPSTQTSVNHLPQYNLFKNKKVWEKSNSLANHLPTGTVLIFQALIPTFSNDGKCRLTNKYLIAWVIGICSLFCFLSSFTDSVEQDGKTYYGIATFKGFWVFNSDDLTKEEEEQIKTDKLKIKKTDYFQAFGSLLVFLVFAFSCSDVQKCYWPHASVETQNSIVVYLPIIVGILSSFFFTIYSTKRTGIGFTSKARKV